MSDQDIKDIKNALQEIKTILLLSNQEQLEDAKKNLLKSGSYEEKMYKLCDGKRTTDNIAKKSGKSNDFTRATLSSLRQKGLIRSIDKNGKTTHEKII